MRHLSKLLPSKLQRLISSSRMLHSVKVQPAKVHADMRMLVRSQLLKLTPMNWQDCQLASSKVVETKLLPLKSPPVKVMRFRSRLE
jgi:hypothetical protein